MSRSVQNHLFDATTINYYKPESTNLRKVTPFNETTFITAFQLKIIMDRLHALQNKLHQDGFMYRLVKEYEAQGIDVNIVIDLMRRVVPQVFPDNIKAGPQETRLYFNKSHNSEGQTVLFGFVDEPRTKTKRRKFADCTVISAFF